MCTRGFAPGSTHSPATNISWRLDCAPTRAPCPLRCEHRLRRTTKADCDRKVYELLSLRRLAIGTFLDLQVSLYWCGQFLVTGIDDEDREQFGWFGLACVTADGVGGAGRFGPALAGLVDPCWTVVDLRLDTSG